MYVHNNHCHRPTAHLQLNILLLLLNCLSMGYDKLLFPERCAVDRMCSFLSSDVSKIPLVLSPLGRHYCVSGRAPVRLAS